VNESYRNIELIRNNKIYTKVDLYNFWSMGSIGKRRLKDNDVIRIPAYNQRVTLEGRLNVREFSRWKRRVFSDLLSFASGFNEFAYTASVNVLQKTAKEFKVQDIKASEFNSYKPLSGDVFRVTKILNRFENRIKIDGRFRPNTYSFMKACVFLIWLPKRTV
jgi:hypothetical protein